MNKNEFIDKVADTADMSKAEAAKAVDAVFDAITKALQSGDDVRLVGFGTFSAAKRAAREGRRRLELDRPGRPPLRQRSARPRLAFFVFGRRRRRWTSRKTMPISGLRRARRRARTSFLFWGG